LLYNDINKRQYIEEHKNNHLTLEETKHIKP
jgi:hypothetical protein